MGMGMGTETETEAEAEAEALLYGQNGRKAKFFVEHV